MYIYIEREEYKGLCARRDRARWEFDAPIVVVCLHGHHGFGFFRESRILGWRFNGNIWNWWAILLLAVCSHGCARCRCGPPPHCVCGDFAVLRFAAGRCLCGVVTAVLSLAADRSLPRGCGVLTAVLSFVAGRNHTCGCGASTAVLSLAAGRSLACSFPSIAFWVPISP